MKKTKKERQRKPDKSEITRKWRFQNEGNYVQFSDTNSQILKIKADQNWE